MDDTAFKQQPIAKKPPKVTNDSILESLRTLGTGVGSTVAKDVVGKTASNALASLFGGPLGQQQAGELRPNRAPDFGRERQPFPGFRRPEVHRPPIVHQEEIGLKQQIDSVRAELKALSESMKMLNKEVEKAISETPVQPGVYHKNFFDRLRSFMALLKEQIDDSRSWLSLSTGRKQKKGYWGMYKKHGTSFGLSNERSLATSAG